MIRILAAGLILMLLPAASSAQVIDIAFQHAFVAHIEQELKAQKFDDADAELQNADAKHLRYTNGRNVINTALEWLFADIGREPGTYLPLLDSWVQKSPTSYMALLIRGKANESMAWRIRGTGFASSVSQDQWEKFRFYDERAAADLTQSYERNPHSALAAAQMIYIWRDNGDARQMADWFARAKTADPDNWNSYDAYIYALPPRWGGDNDTMLAFARDAAKSHTEPLFGVLLVVAHRELAQQWRESGKNIQDYYAQPEVWKELKAVMEKVLAAYPASMLDHNRLAFYASCAGQFSVAKKEFAIIGDAWEPSIWQSKYIFSGTKQRALSGVNTQTSHGKTVMAVFLALIPVILYVGFAALIIKRKRSSDSESSAGRSYEPAPVMESGIIMQKKGPSAFTVFASICLCAIIGGMVAQQIFGEGPDASNPAFRENNKVHTTFYDSLGRARIDLGMYNGQAGQNFWSNEGALRLQLGTYTNDLARDEKGLPVLALYNQASSIKGFFRLDGANQSPLFILKNNADNTEVVMGLDLSGPEDPFLVYFDKKTGKHALFGDLRF